MKLTATTARRAAPEQPGLFPEAATQPVLWHTCPVCAGSGRGDARTVRCRRCRGEGGWFAETAPTPQLVGPLEGLTDDGRWFHGSPQQQECPACAQPMRLRRLPDGWAFTCPCGQAPVYQGKAETIDEIIASLAPKARPDAYAGVRKPLRKPLRNTPTS